MQSNNNEPGQDFFSQKNGGSRSKTNGMTFEWADQSKYLMLTKNIWNKRNILCSPKIFDITVHTVPAPPCAAACEEIGRTFCLI